MDLNHKQSNRPGLRSYNITGSSNSPVFIKDSETGEVLHVNNTALDLLNIPREQILNTDFDALIETYSTDFSDGQISLNDHIYSVDSKEVELLDKKLAWIVLHPVSVAYTEDFKTLLQKMAEVLVHRLRSPLTGMLGFARLIDQTAGDTNKRYVQQIQRGLKDLAHFLDRIEKLSENIVVQINRFPVQHLTSDLLSEFSHSYKGRIEIKITDEAGFIETDFILLRSILRELVTNALEHDQESIVEVHVLNNSTFRVINYGKAIPPGFMAMAFSPFSSLKARNMGLGLTISKMQAEAIGASLQISQNSATDGIIFELKLGQGGKRRQEGRRSATDLRT